MWRKATAAENKRKMQQETTAMYRKQGEERRGEGIDGMRDAGCREALMLSAAPTHRHSMEAGKPLQPFQFEVPPRKRRGSGTAPPPAAFD